jgi:hypothetical protein
MAGVGPGLSPGPGWSYYGFHMATVHLYICDQYSNARGVLFKPSSIILLHITIAHSRGSMKGVVHGFIRGHMSTHFISAGVN